MQASPRVAQELRLRVERKDSSTAGSRTPHQQNGSPRRGGIIDPQEVLVAFQRGVSMGMTQAAQAQLMPPPLYPQYPCYSAFDPSLTQSNLSAAAGSDASLPNSQAFGNGYIGPMPGEISYANPPAHYGHYAPPQPHHHYVVPNPVVSHYQWPPATTADENVKNTRGLQEEH